MRPSRFSFLLFVAAASPMVAQNDSTWRDHNRAADAAIARRDWSGARHHALAVDSLLGGHPGAAMYLARIAALSGDTAEAIAQVRRVGTMGVIARTTDSAFAPLRGLP